MTEGVHCTKTNSLVLKNTMIKPNQVVLVFTALGWVTGITILYDNKLYVQCLAELINPQPIVLMMETIWVNDKTQQPDKLTNIALYALNNESAVDYSNKYHQDIQVIHGIA